MFSHIGWVIQQDDSLKGNNSILGELAPEDLTAPKIENLLYSNQKDRHMTDPRYLIGSSQFAALEPSWAGIHNERDLRGLLILGVLFNKTVYIHDTQIADNPHLLKSYKVRHDREANLFNLIKMLVEHKVIRVGIRDATYIAEKDQEIPCVSLLDVYNSWLYQDKNKAWITPPNAKDRTDLLKDFDEVLSHVDVLRYPYITIKKEFIRRTRAALDYSADSIYSREFRRLPLDVRKRYEDIINRDWFTHSDIFELLTKSGYTIAHPFVQSHGLFDESSYAHWNQSRLLGCNSPLWNAEGIVTGFKETDQTISKAHITHKELQKNAIRTIEAPGLSLIATLSPNEILQLREKGTELYQIVEFMSECNSIDTVSELHDNYLEAVTAYWTEICSYLRTTRPFLTQRRTKIGIFARDKLPNFPSWGKELVSFTINIGFDLLRSPILKILGEVDLQNLLDKSFFRFIFFSDVSAMTQLESAFPKKSWISRYHFDVFGGGKP